MTKFSGMNRFLLTALTRCLLCLSVPHFVLAQVDEGDSARAVPSCPEGSTWTGSADAAGKATQRVEPDEASVSITVSITQGTPVEARTVGTNSFDAVTGALKDAGLNSTAIQTTGFQIEPNYDTGTYYYENRGQVPANFTYTQTIDITSTPDELGGYIDTAVEAGNSSVRIGAVSFHVSQRLAQDTLNALRGTAVANAIETVTVMITASGGQVGSPMSIIDSSYPPYLLYGASPQASFRDPGATGGDSASVPSTELYGGLVDVDADVRVKMAICM